MNMPLMANRIGETIMMRVRSTASDRSSRPGAMAGTSQGARMSPSTAKTTVDMATRFNTALASRQASLGLCCVNRRAKTGMKAAASSPFTACAKALSASQGLNTYMTRTTATPHRIRFSKKGRSV